MLDKNKLVYGIGISDADSQAYKFCEETNRKVAVGPCPFYTKWMNMLTRCYSPNYHRKQPTYIGSSVDERWHRLSNFKSWMQTQDWEGKQLDKDILFPGNKIYSPETCVFVELKVNVFTTERNSKRGELPIGVSQSKGSTKYIAECRSVVSKGKKYLGAFDTPEEAHAVWLAFKLEQAYILAAEQTDPRVAKALIDRYKNYKMENPL